MALNTPANTRTDIPDFVSALDYPDDPKAFLDYVRANQINGNIEHDKEVLVYNHAADGEHESWSPAANATYIDAFNFSVAGDYTAAFFVGGLVILDCGEDGVFYTRIEALYKSGDDTIFQVAGGVLTANLASAAFGVPADWRAVSQAFFHGSFEAANDTNLLDSSGDYTSPTLNTGAAIERILARGLFFLDGGAAAQLKLQKDDGEGGWDDVKTFNLNAVTAVSVIAADTDFRVLVNCDSGAVCQSIEILVG